jgi:hypothetical protein
VRSAWLSRPRGGNVQLRRVASRRVAGATRPGGRALRRRLVPASLRSHDPTPPLGAPRHPNPNRRRGLRRQSGTLPIPGSPAGDASAVGQPNPDASRHALRAADRGTAQPGTHDTRAPGPRAPSGRARSAADPPGPARARRLTRRGQHPLTGPGVPRRVDRIAPGTLHLSSVTLMARTRPRMTPTEWPPSHSSHAKASAQPEGKGHT